MSGTPRRLVTIWKNRAEELFKSLLLKENNLCFSQFAHCFGFSWLIFQDVKIALLFCAAHWNLLALWTKNLHVSEYTNGMSIFFSVTNSDLHQVAPGRSISGQMAQELSWTRHLNSVCSDMLNSTQCHNLPPASWHGALPRSYRNNSLYLLVYIILNNKSILQLVFPVFPPSIFFC